jgi:hypothetical protein
MFVTSVLFLCIAAVAILFFAQRKRDKQNAEDTQRLRALGLRWSDWFGDEGPDRRPHPTVGSDEP